MRKNERCSLFTCSRAGKTRVTTDARVREWNYCEGKSGERRGEKRKSKEGEGAKAHEASSCEVRERDGVGRDVEGRVHVLEEAEGDEGERASQFGKVEQEEGKAGLGSTHEAPRIQALMPMSAPTMAPTQRSLPDETLPRLSDSGEMAHCSPNVWPNENEMDGAAAHG